MNLSTLNHIRLSLAAGFLSILLGGNPTWAGLILDFPIPQLNPDFYSTISSITYNAGTDTFSIAGVPQNVILPDSTEINDFLSSPMPAFTITADITATGAIGGGGGILSITGKSVSLGNVNTNLLSGVLEQFGYSQPNVNSGRFEFIFGSLTGVLAPYFATGKAYALVTAVQELTAYNGTFGNDFSFSGARLNVDTFGVPVPEPATAALAGVALAALLAVGRARRRTAGFLSGK